MDVSKVSAKRLFGLLYQLFYLLSIFPPHYSAVKNKIGKLTISHSDSALLCLIHKDDKIQMSYPHLVRMKYHLHHFCGYFVYFPIPFYHHLCYNNLVIQDTRLCIAECKVHLHPLWSVGENFPITLKMYFLCSALSPCAVDSTPDISA